MFYLILGIFVFFKIFLNAYDIVLAIPISGLVLYYAFKNKEQFLEYFCLFILLNSSYFYTAPILLVLVGIWGLRAAHNHFLLKKIEVAYLFLLVAFTVSLLFLHSAPYDALRYITLITCPIILLHVIQRTTITERSFNRIYAIYISTVVANLIYTFFIASGERNSIFIGTENIGLVTISLFYVLIVSWLKSGSQKLFASLLFLLTLASMGSRSVLLILFILAFRYLLAKKWTIKSFSGVVSALAPILILASIYAQTLVDIPRFQRMLGAIDVVQSLDISNLRGVQSQDYTFLRVRLYFEAIDLIRERPWFGHGVRTPKILEDLHGPGLSSFHNAYSDILVANGIVGLSIIFIFFWYLYRLPQHNNLASKSTLRTILIVFILASFIQPVFFNIQACTLFYFFIAASQLRRGDHEVL